MKKQDIIISDDALTKEQKEKLEQEFFERQQKELHKGKLFLTASVIALYANAVITAALYPLYLRNLLHKYRYGDSHQHLCRKEKRCKTCGGCIVYTCRGYKSADSCNAVKLDSDLQRYSGRNCNVRKHSVLLCVRSRHIHNDIQVEYFGLYLCGGVGNVRKSRKQIIYLKSKFL